MWPWSTIRRLRSALADAQDDANRFSLRIGALKQESEQWQQRWTKLNENYETVQHALDVASKALDKRSDTILCVTAERDEVQRKLADFQNENAKLESAWNKAVADMVDAQNQRDELAANNIDLTAEIGRLRDELEKASRNDRRGPDGRFITTKSVAGPTGDEVGH